MKKALKTALSVILCICFMLGAALPSFAEADTPSLLNVYGDGMLFQQKKEAIIRGNAGSGAEIFCEVKNGADVVCKAKSTANKKGGFSVSFKAPDGGYKKYTITVYADGKEIQTLNDVVFGELWLSSGQSNMQYGFGQSDTYEQNSSRSEWLRFLYVDPYPTYNGDTESFPNEAMSDFEDGCCRWYKGTDNIAGVSAVSVFFAQKLEKQLQMPVGVLTPNLGGSMLDTWLSRETIDSDPVYADYLKKQGLYLSNEEWDSEKVDCYSTMTANYNKKIAPLSCFNIAGMIWYQGESEFISGWEIGCYTRGLELLQSSYSELFRFSGEKMPFIATQVAPYAYGDNQLNLHNNEFVEFQNADPASRAVTTIYDLDLGYINEVGSIHPGAKQPVGERMAACADGLVYKNSTCYTAAAVESVKIDGGNVYVTLKNTGDGLVIDGSCARGFALCDESGVYVQAEAEIVNKNTLKIYSDEVKNPIGASYAFAENNSESNVYSTLGGEKFLPVAPFTTNAAGDKLYFEDPAWARCDSEKGFLLAGGSDAGVNPLWSAEKATITVDTSTQYKGEGCLNVVSESKKSGFSISPTITYKDGADIEYFDLPQNDWRNYKTVTVMVRNNGLNDVKLDKMKIYTNRVTWFTPEVNACGEEKAVIPADGQWYKLTFDLDRLYLFGNECGAVYSRKKLSEINGFELCFKDGRGVSSDISVDEVRFTADGSEGKTGFFESCVSRADDPWEFFCSLFTTLFSLIAGIFNK